MKPARTIGILGKTPFTAFLETIVPALIPNIEVRVFSPENDTTLAASFEEVCDSDIVLFVIDRLTTFEETLLAVLPKMKEEATLVEISLAKCTPTKFLKEHAYDRRYVSVRPLFGPKSFVRHAKRLDGFKLLVFEREIPQLEYDEICRFLSEYGLEIVDDVDVDTHDRLLAHTLFASQYISHLGLEMGLERTEYDTLSFDSYMDAIDVTKHFHKTLMSDLYKTCSHCREVIDELRRAQAEVDRECAEEAFLDIIDEILKEEKIPEPI